MRITNKIYYTPKLTTATPTASNPINAEQNSLQNINYSKIAFGAIHNIKPKKINLELEKNKLLKQIRTILSENISDSDPADRIFAAIDKALAQFKNKMQREVQLLEQLQELVEDPTIPTGVKISKANALNKEFNLLRKRKIVVKKPEFKPEDETLDYQLINRFKTALEDGNFNLRKVLIQYYQGLNNIKSIEELNKTYPKIKTPKRPEQVIASKIVKTLTRDFYQELDKYLSSGMQSEAVNLLERQISSVSIDTAKDFSVNPEVFAQRIVTDTAEAIMEKYYELIKKDSLSSMPSARKISKPQINLLDIKLLAVDFDDFVLSTVRRHYLAGEKINSMSYSSGSININLNELRNSDYKFEKMSEKVKKIAKNSDELFKAQRDYPNYDIEQFQARLNHYAESEIGSDEKILSSIIDFHACNYTQEDINLLIKFLRELDSVADGETTLTKATQNILANDYRPRGTEKLNELERQKAEELVRIEQKKTLKLKQVKTEFNDAINMLYMNNLNNIASTCSKYEPQSLDASDIEQAQYLINLITNTFSKDKITNADKLQLETQIRRWDVFTTYKKSSPESQRFQSALQFATKPNGTLDTQKAGQYLINSEIAETYPQCLEFVENPELISKIIERNSDDAVPYLCKLDDYQILPSEDKASILKIKDIFNIKDATDKIILKHIIENDYINSDTVKLVDAGDGTSTITATISANVKPEILNKYKFPQCLDYFTDFEEALSLRASDRDCAGIKLTGRNNKSNKYKMELKILRSDDRLFSSKNDYCFDIYSDKGMH